MCAYLLVKIENTKKPTGIGARMDNLVAKTALQRRLEPRLTVTEVLA